MSEKEVFKKIKLAVPSAANMLKGAIPARLKKLSKTAKSEGRAVRWHKTSDRYCLAYEFRKLVQKDNADDELLRIKVRDIFVSRIQACKSVKLSAKLVQSAADISLAVIQKTFESQGLEFAALVERGEQRHAMETISDYVDACADEHP